MTDRAKGYFTYYLNRSVIENDNVCGLRQIYPRTKEDAQKAIDEFVSLPNWYRYELVAQHYTPGGYNDYSNESIKYNRKYKK